MEKFIKVIVLPVVIILVLTLPVLILPNTDQALGAGVDRKALAMALAQLDKESGKKTLSPFFFVGGDDPELDQLPLKSTNARVNIAGVMAEVTITQVYKNEGKKTLEAVYIFPGSTRAAVHALRMTIGDRIIDAQIMERKKARETYEEAKAQGQTASLLEQQRPNVFQMNVANILPGDEIKVELKYNELIVPEEGVYQFVYPAVVGPRYSNVPAGSKDDKETWVQNPYLHEGEGAPYKFGLSVDLRSGPDLAMLGSPSHEIQVEYTGKTRAQVKLMDDPKAGTKDFVLEYRLAGDKIESGLLLYPGDKENHFLLMVEPPKRIVPETIVPREYIFVVDVSGSMRGFPLNISKELMTNIITGLRPNEYMNVLLFAGGAAILSNDGSLPATEENKAKAISWLNSAKGGGGTELLPALKKAMAMPSKEGMSRIMVVITDGYVSVEPQAIDLVKSNLGQANLFTFGIGTSVNRYLIEVLARVGKGNPQVILKKDHAAAQAEKFRKYIESPVLTGIKARFQGFRVSDVEPVSIPDLFGERPIVLFGKYSGDPQGKIILTGKTAKGEFVKEIQVTPELASSDNAALKYLWARSRITALSDLNNLRSDPDLVKEVIELGLKYNLLTAYTSFVAVDKLKRADGQVVTVKQPVPLPEGVSDSAVGGAKRMLKGRALPSPAPTGSEGMVAAESAQVQVREPKNKPKPPYVRITLKQAKAWPDTQAVLKALEEKQSLFDQCYRQARMHIKDLQGSLEVTFKVDSKGKAWEIRIGSAKIKDPGLVKCLIKALEAVDFPAPASAKGKVRLVLELVG